ncbi:DUF2849 domain-containing protein [Asticcacaulis sp. EMRT-3]|uniref:DUF2849 domain-containing protein n=1 Tax=Asticcacaulis sp. EMRT-3 TaxID=3040349 RepID=UPI0024AEAFC5|nr:DUF2849 domain-containing protein [Asticcacaulis sp. EMRT-3]MDI7775633.1 DUF2849 domain-containing protein [Asticcacaulis sp. EMRT-3]
MKLLTANRLWDGTTLWYGADGWVEDGALAVSLEDERADALLKDWLARETEVVGPYLIPLTPEDVPVQREHVREFVRANGPTTGPLTDGIARAYQRADIF